MAAYYNEIDPFCASWLRELIKGGHIADGVVDTRSIEDVTPEELSGYTQHHFFAGIGVWSYALRSAGWPDDRPVWTGSCPCQPFSQAGKGGGFDDERHLWPSWHWLIKQHKPAVIFGEQVTSKTAEPWVDLVQADLEAVGYAFGCVPFPAAGVGAPHIRDRAYWVANSQGERGDRIENTTGKTGGTSSKAGGETNGFWSGEEWLECSDGKQRPIKPGIMPLADGDPGRVGTLRGYGNAINAEAAKEFILACDI